MIPNGFDFENFSELKPAHRTQQRGRLTMISVGSVWPRKGHHNVIRALPAIKKKFPELTYHIVGRKADMSKINGYIGSDIMKDVIFHGQANPSTLQNLLKDSGIFILLSELQDSGDFEGFGIAAIEANFFGLPAVGSLSSGLEDAIENNVSGILVDPKDDVQIADAIENIMNDYERFSKNAVEWALRHHWSNVVKEYLTAFKNIAD